MHQPAVRLDNRLLGLASWPLLRVICLPVTDRLKKLGLLFPAYMIIHQKLLRRYLDITSFCAVLDSKTVPLAEENRSM
jgi:hypothetical protein